jgi:hypothetical protein
MFRRGEKKTTVKPRFIFFFLFQIIGKKLFFFSIGLGIDETTMILTCWWDDVSFP